MTARRDAGERESVKREARTPAAADIWTAHSLDPAYLYGLLRSRVRRHLPAGDFAFEDVVHEAALRFSRALIRGEVRNPEGLLTVIAERAAADEIKRRVRDRAVVDASGSHLDSGDRAQAQSRTDAATKAMSLFLVRQLMATCVPEEQVLLIRHAEGAGWEDVAREVGRSPDAIRQQWSRLTKRLRSRIDRVSEPTRSMVRDVFGF